jgi:transposase-like protein
MLVMVTATRVPGVRGWAVALAVSARAGCNTSRPFPLPGGPVTMAGCEDSPTVIVVLDLEAGARALAAGALSCPDCRGVLRSWGLARPRRLRRLDGGHVDLRPQRARCASCRATHVVLPAVGLPRSGYTVEAVGAALTARHAGAGHRAVAASLGLPAGTVRGWLRQARHGAEALRVHATQIAYRYDRDTGPLEPAGSPLGDALVALSAAARACARRLHLVAPVWQLIALLTGGRLLSSAPSG